MQRSSEHTNDVKEADARVLERASDFQTTSYHGGARCGVESLLW